MKFGDPEFDRGHRSVEGRQAHDNVDAAEMHGLSVI